MFIFYGSLKKEIIYQSSKKQSLNFFIITLPFTILGFMISLILGVLKLPGFIEILGLTCLFLIISCLFVILPPNSAIHKLSTKITFNISHNSITIEREGLKDKYSIPRIKNISKIKSVLDYGDWYLITFKGDITDNIICQKDLLVQGSIEDFENTFKDKIKYPKKKAI